MLISIIAIGLLPLIGMGVDIYTLSAEEVTALAKSGETQTVPQGKVYEISLADGSVAQLEAGTTFYIAEEDGLLQVVIEEADGKKTPLGPNPPYERMKDLPETIVRENLNDLSPS